MKWQAISNFSDTLDKEIKAQVQQKRERDAASEIPNIWSEFVMQTSSMLDNAQNYLEVKTDDKGALNCLTSFPEDSEYYKDNNKPFANYVLEKFDTLSKTTISNAKNRVTRAQLLTRIGGYKTYLAEHLSKIEARLIHDKRYSDSIDGIERTARAVYTTPHLFEYSLSAVIDSINSLSITQEEKSKLSKIAAQQIAYHAGLGYLHSNPNHVLTTGINDSWKSYLSVPQVLKLERQANNILHQKQHILQQGIRDKFKSHIDSILSTGSGIIGFDSLARQGFGENSVEYNRMKEEEELAQIKYQGLQDLKYLSFDEGVITLNQNKPETSDAGNALKQQIHDSLKKELHKQIKSANSDPVQFVETLFSDELDGVTDFEERLKLRKNLQISKGIIPKYLTRDEKHLILNKINSDDSSIVESEINKILNLGNKSNNIGLEVLDEVLDGNNHLKIPVLFYAKRRMLNQEAHEFAEMIPRTMELFSMQSVEESSKLKRAIDSNADFKLWKKKTILHQPHNLNEVDVMYDGIRHLARFYQIERALSGTHAVERAVKKLIAENYITDFGFFDNSLSSLVLPKHIISDGKIAEIDANNIKQNLLKIRHDIINRNIEFDIDESFGSINDNFTDTHEQIYKTRDAIIKDLLSSGRFFLSRDKKKIHFYFFSDNNYHALMKDNKELTFELLDLSN